MKINDNQKNFIIGVLCSGILFFVGVLYLIIPTYYGLEKMANINVNNLFISLMITIAALNFVKFFILGKNPNNETIYMSIASCGLGLLNIILTHKLESGVALAISLIVYILLIVGIKLFTIDYYHDRNDAYFYIEGMLTFIFFVVGVIISISLFNDTVLQTMLLGFFIIIGSILDAVNVSIKTMLKAKRFLRKIKLN